MDETMNAVNETAISQEPETQQETVDVNETDTQPQVQENDEGTSATSQEEETAPQVAENEEPFLEIKYLKENIGLSREEAKNFAEIGKRYSGVRDRLERVATLKGQSVEDFLKGIETAEDEAYRNGLVSKFGEDNETVDKLMELYNIEKEKKLQSAADNRKQAAEQEVQSVNARIAEEFQKMKAEFPELTDYASLPSVVKEAAYNGMSLEHAYLKYGHSEQKKVDAAKASEEAAAKKSTGSMSTDEGGAVTDPFIEGIFGR